MEKILELDRPQLLQGEAMEMMKRNAPGRQPSVRRISGDFIGACIKRLIYMHIYIANQNGKRLNNFHSP
jgi:hypothetical protein